MRRAASLWMLILAAVGTASLPLGPVEPDVTTADVVLLRAMPDGAIQVWYGPRRGAQEQRDLEPGPDLPAEATPEQRLVAGIVGAVRRIVQSQEAVGATVPDRLRYECRADQLLVPAWALVRNVALAVQIPRVVLSSRGRGQGVEIVLPAMLLFAPVAGELVEWEVPTNLDVQINRRDTVVVSPSIPVRLLGASDDDLRALFMRHPGDEGRGPRNRLLGMLHDGTPLNINWVREQVRSARVDARGEPPVAVTLEVHEGSPVRARTVIDLLDGMDDVSGLALQLLVNPRPTPRNYFPAELAIR